jgi:spore maturation protein CgeB
MKLLIVGSDKNFAIENFYVKYLREFGVDVSVFAAQTVFSDYYQHSLLNKVLFKAGLSHIYKRINTVLKERISLVRPDIVWVFKGMEVYPETLKWISRKGIKLVNYNPDNPFLFSGKGSGNKNITESVGLYDMHFSYDEKIRQLLRQQGNAKVHSLPFGFDLDEKVYNSCVSQQEIERVCFLGNPDQYRAAFLKEVAKATPVDVYGHHWGKFLADSNVTVFDPVYDEDLWKTLRKYRVQINLMRPHNPQSHNMRSFEAPAVGGILLAPETADHINFFKPGEEIFVYKDVSSCISEAISLLSLSASDAEDIRSKARARSVNSGYNYRSRAMEVLGFFKALLNGSE